MRAFLDIETGGFSKTKNGVCEIAIIVVDEKYEVVDTLHFLIKPYLRENSNKLVAYNDDAMKVNGLTVEQLLSDGISIEVALTRIIFFLDQHNVMTLIGHNSRVFDVPRIAYLLHRFKRYSIAHLRQEDTMLIAKRKMRLKSYSLEKLCFHFGIVNQKKHSAEGDTLATIELYKKLI